MRKGKSSFKWPSTVNEKEVVNRPPGPSRRELTARPLLGEHLTLGTLLSGRSHQDRPNPPGSTTPAVQRRRGKPSKRRLPPRTRPARPAKPTSTRRPPRRRPASRAPLPSAHTAVGPPEVPGQAGLPAAGRGRKPPPPRPGAGQWAAGEAATARSGGGGGGAGPGGAACDALR